MIIEVNPVQQENAISPMDVTLLEMVTDVNLVQPENALRPISPNDVV